MKKTKNYSKLLQDLYLKEPTNEQKLLKLTNSFIKYTKQLEKINSEKEKLFIEKNNDLHKTNRIIDNIVIDNYKKLNEGNNELLFEQKEQYERDLLKIKAHTYNNDKWKIYHDEMLKRISKKIIDNKFDIHKPLIKKIYRDILIEWRKNDNYKPLPTIDNIYKDYHRHKQYIKMQIKDLINQHKGQNCLM